MPNELNTPSEETLIRVALALEKLSPDAKIGNLGDLTTQAKTNLVAAVNENVTKLGEIPGIKNTLTQITYEGSGAHNSIYRGKYLGSSVTPAQYATISTGKFEDMYIGDYWTIGGTDYVIAAFNYYLGVGDTGVVVNHVTLIPRVALYNHVMNDTNITTGGYVGSKMYTEGLNQAKTKIKAAFPGRVLKHRKLLSNATVDGKASGWAWVDSEIDLMTEVMVYGSVVWGESTIGGSGYNIGVGKTQLPLFRFRPDMISMRSHVIWLSCVVSATNFASVHHNGFAYDDIAGYAYGVLPAFSIS